MAASSPELLEEFLPLQGAESSKTVGCEVLFMEVGDYTEASDYDED